MREPRILLFDLGGVLIENVMFDELPSLLDDPPPLAVLQDRWLASEAVRLFERGAIEVDEFGRLFVAEWGLALAPDAFLARFAQWPRGPFEGALDLLAGLQRRYTTACLTNCNALHWQRLALVLAQMDHAVSSHLSGCVKPDPAAFAYTVAVLGCDPGDIVFFDDSARNVEAALAAGMEAYQTPGFQALQCRLTALGLLSRVDKIG